MKKASAEMTIKWIFALIAGGFILFFFMNFYEGYKATAEEKAMVDIKIKLNNILGNAQGHPYTIIPFPVAETQLSYDDCTTGLYMNNNRNLRMQLGDLFTFNTITTQTNELLLFVLPFKLPFQITNFIYLTSPDIRFVFLKSGDSQDVLNTLLDPRTNKIFVPGGKVQTLITDEFAADGNKISELGNLLSDNYYKTIFVLDKKMEDNEKFTGTMPTTFSNMDNVNILRIDPDPNKNSGKVELTTYRKTKNGDQTKKQTAYYIDESTLIGAILSDDLELYNCTLANAFVRMGGMLDILEKRCESIYKGYEQIKNDATPNLPLTCNDYETIYDSSFGCGSAVSDMSNNIKNGDLSTSTTRANIRDSAHSELYADSLYYVNNLQAKNKDCPLIY